jgi:hypothetical protein
MFALRGVRARARVAAIGGLACGSLVSGLLAGALPAVAAAPPAVIGVPDTDHGVQASGAARGH